MQPPSPNPPALALHMRNMEACAEALISAVQKHRQAVAVGELHFARLVNVSVFALVWNADLSTLIHDIEYPDLRLGQVAGWRQKLAARLLALTMVEATEAFSHLLGRDFRESVVALGGEAMLETLKPLGRALSRFRDEHDPELRLVRNTIIGHRDRDGLAQVDSLAALDAGEIAALGWQLLAWTTSLHSYVIEVLALVAERPLTDRSGAA